jgi:hypothetical protein
VRGSIQVETNPKRPSPGAGPAAPTLVPGGGSQGHHAAHELCRDGKEMPAVLPADLALIEKLEIDLVDDRRDLKPVVAPFRAQLAGRNRPQLVVDQTDESKDRG